MSNTTQGAEIMATEAVTFGSHIDSITPPRLEELKATLSDGDKPPITVVMEKYLTNIIAANVAALAMVAKSGGCRELAQRYVLLFEMNIADGKRGLSKDDEAKAQKNIAEFTAMSECHRKLCSWHATAIAVMEYVTEAVLPEQSAKISGTTAARTIALEHQATITSLERSLRASLQLVDTRKSTWQTHIDALQSKLTSLASADSGASSGGSWFGWGRDDVLSVEEPPLPESPPPEVDAEEGKA